MVLSTPRIRRLFTLACLHFCFFRLLEGRKLTSYLVHPMPFWVMPAVLAGRDFFSARPRAGVACAAVLVALQAIAAYQDVRRTGGGAFYALVAEVLRKHPGAVITGPAEFAFAVGFDGAPRDGPRSGYYTRRRPDIFITKGWQRERLEQAAVREPAVARARLQSE